jgi:hypothetical protein
MALPKANNVPSQVQEKVIQRLKQMWELKDQP